LKQNNFEISEISHDFSEKEIATAKENEDTLQLEMPLEMED
jgi:hypothetical protein